MINDIYNFDFTRTLPPALKENPEMLAIGKVISEAMRENMNLTRNAVIYARIDELPEDILDIIAHDLSVDWYDDSHDIEIKRQVIKDSVRVHKRLGTKFAVETALSAVYPDTFVQEWFEYGGEPYMFRVIITADPSNPEKQREALDKIHFFKNLRSHLEEVVYRTPINGEATAYVGVKPVSTYMRINTEVKLYGMD
ncbi:MAG: phage tail protein I [Oscillospiraceae bacterium]|nr:phage tail protein I [Oscillospiraceae bacterium]